MRSFILVCICLMLTSQAFGNRHGVRSFLSGKEIAAKARGLFLAGAVAVVLVSPNAVQAEEGSTTEKVDTTAIDTTKEENQVAKESDNSFTITAKEWDRITDDNNYLWRQVRELRDQLQKLEKKLETRLATEPSTEETSDASNDDSPFWHALGIAGGWGHDYGYVNPEFHSLLLGTIYEAVAQSSDGKLMEIELAALGNLGDVGNSTNQKALDNSYLSAASHIKLPLATSDVYSGSDDHVVLFFDGGAAQYPHHGRRAHAIVGIGFSAKGEDDYGQEYPTLQGNIGIGTGGYGKSKYKYNNRQLSKWDEESSYFDIESDGVLMISTFIGKDPVRLGYRFFGVMKEKSYSEFRSTHELTAVGHLTDTISLRGLYVNYNSRSDHYVQLMANIRLNSLFD